MMKRFVLRIFVLSICLNAATCHPAAQDQYVYETFFKDKKRGTFVEIGSFLEPQDSRTYTLEKDQGWKGLYIQDSDEGLEKLKAFRNCLCLKENLLGPSGSKKGALSSLIKDQGLEHVHFMSLSTGKDELALLKSLDFTKLSVDVITARVDTEIAEALTYMKDHGFQAVRRIGEDVVFVRQGFTPSRSEESVAKAQAKKTVCLNMIVKNESQVIERCLSSLKDHIDYWVIVDTGSTDNTQEIIREFMKDIPGELFERPWVDFGHNRHEAMTLAKGKGDYLLFIDADEELVFDSSFTGFALEADCYSMPIREPHEFSTVFQRAGLINNHLAWKWKDVIHEFLEPPAEAKTFETLKDVKCITYSDGGRSQDPKKSLKDAQVLEKALEKDPNNPRYVFYLAQSYYNAKEYDKAIKNYEKRTRMGKAKEVFWSYYAAASLQQHLEKDSKLFLENFSKAYEVEPTRAESLYQMAAHYNRNEQFTLAYAMARLASSIPKPKQGLYIVDWIYDYGIHFSLGYSALKLGKFEEACGFFEKVLSSHLPSEIRAKAEGNYKAAIEGKSKK